MNISQLFNLSNKDIINILHPVRFYLKSNDVDDYFVQRLDGEDEVKEYENKGCCVVSVFQSELDDLVQELNQMEYEDKFIRWHEYWRGLSEQWFCDWLNSMMKKQASR